MKRSRIQIVITFSVLALIGSIAVQYYWVSQLYKQNRFLLDQNINNALKHAVSKLQKEEEIYKINRFFGKSPTIKNKHKTQQLKEIENKQGKTQNKKTQVIVHSQTKKTRKNNNNEEIIVYSDLDTNIRFIESDNDWFALGDNLETNIQIKIETDSILQSFEAKADSLIQILEFKTIDIQKEKEELETTIDQLVWEMDDWASPFYDSIPSDLIKNTLNDVFDEYNLPLNFEFEVLSGNKPIIVSDGFDSDNINYQYFTKLYPDNLIPRKQILVVQLASNVMYYKMSGPVILSLLFTLILAIGLWLIIKNMLHHRNISQIQNDFINNMTHEFKTPIATISLASDSILNPGIIENQEKVGYFTGMIKKENKRMNRLVEKILQMARLENKEFKLEKQKIAVHDILEMIGENTKIKLKDSGEINLKLKATNNTITADQLHLTNVFYNLIDNAIKYSAEPKNIEIETLNQKSYLVVRIKDNGHGMDKKEVQHIFDRFYRIEAGNVHNIKGYGLGLTYVKAVIDKHQGQINVKSEPGIGSTFEIKLPI